MKFEWDPDKSRANLAKHGIDFETGRALWFDDGRVEILAPHPIEERRIIIGKLDNKLWTAVFTLRGDAIRIISVRRARRKEVSLYGQKRIG